MSLLANQAGTGPKLARRSRHWREPGHESGQESNRPSSAYILLDRLRPGEAGCTPNQNPAPTGDWCLPDDRFGIRTCLFTLLPAPMFRPIYGSNEHRFWEHKTRSTIYSAGPYPARQKRRTRAWLSGGRSTRHSSNGEQNLIGEPVSSGSDRSRSNGKGVRAMLSRPMGAADLKPIRSKRKRWRESFTERNRLRAQGRSAPQRRADISPKIADELPPPVNRSFGPTS